MQLTEQVRATEFLGREFLLWLWFKSETHDGVFDIGENGTAELRVTRRIVLQSEEDDAIEKITCSGDNPRLKEARFALKKNKAVTEVMVKLTIEDNEWSFILDSSWLNFKSFKTPKVIQDTEEDPDGLFYEKYFLIQEAIAAVDRIFECFIKVRISSDWKKRELPALREWIRKVK